MPRPCGANCKEGKKKKSKCREGILIETSCVGGQFADREEVLGWRWGGGGAGASGLRPAAGGCRSADGDQTSPRGRARSGDAAATSAALERHTAWVLMVEVRGETGAGGPGEASLMIIPENRVWWCVFFFSPLQNHTSLSSEKIKLIVSFLNPQLKVSGNVLKCKTAQQTKCGGDADRQHRFPSWVFLRGFGGGGGGETTLKRRRSNGTGLRRVCRRWVFISRLGRNVIFAPPLRPLLVRGWGVE